MGGGKGGGVANWGEGGVLWVVVVPPAPPPAHCENNTPCQRSTRCCVRTTLELGDFFLWLSMKIKCFSVIWGRGWHFWGGI